MKRKSRQDAAHVGAPANAGASRILLAPPDQRQCLEKVNLVADYGAAVTAYYNAVSKLEEGMITGSPQMYRDRFKSTESARAMCEAARKALAEHDAEHGC